ncbi:MAG: type II toxin-antitoxin system RelE/ParE family toxin [Rhizobiaceae bacterium]
MRLLFTQEAKRDLDNLRAHLRPLSAAGLANVVASIESKIRAGLANPRMGRLTARDEVRELVEQKYGFAIPYFVKGDSFFVLRVYRARQIPLDYEKLDVPKDQ